jgi:DNA/RNA-binding domain of Phe-tRNA-synthetase-like protein
MTKRAMQLMPDPEVAEALGDFTVLGALLLDLHVSGSPEELIARMRETESRIRHDAQIEQVKDDEAFRAYRDFFWRTGVDPTKTRPASEALTRRILRGRGLPLINSFVDALNVASVETKVPFAAFDADRLAGPLSLRFARPLETILPIGHSEHMVLAGKEIVISDGEKLVAIYPHRDSDETKISSGTRSAVVLSCGVPGISFEMVRESLHTCSEEVLRYCGGRVSEE